MRYPLAPAQSKVDHVDALFSSPLSCSREQRHLVSGIEVFADRRVRRHFGRRLFSGPPTILSNSAVDESSPSSVPAGALEGHLGAVLRIRVKCDRPRKGCEPPIRPFHLHRGTVETVETPTHDVALSYCLIFVQLPFETRQALRL